MRYQAALRSDRSKTRRNRRVERLPTPRPHVAQREPSENAGHSGVTLAHIAATQRSQRRSQAVPLRHIGAPETTKAPSWGASGGLYLAISAVKKSLTTPMCRHHPSCAVRVTPTASWTFPPKTCPVGLTGGASFVQRAAAWKEHARSRALDCNRRPPKGSHTRERHNRSRFRARPALYLLRP